jgi:hypothetical protein
MCLSLIREIQPLQRNAGGGLKLGAAFWGFAKERVKRLRFPLLLGRA